MNKTLKFTTVFCATLFIGLFMGGKEAQAAPTCSSAGPDGTVTYANSGTVPVTVYGVTETSTVFLPTWSEADGQGDIVWYGADGGGGTFTANINLASHPGLGNIVSHAYLLNYSTGTWVVCDSAYYVRQNPPPPPVPTCTAALPDGDTVVGSAGSRYTYITGASTDVTSVIFYAWSDSGGQDDIVAWPGQNEGSGKWSINIAHASHPDNGNINVHVYMYTAYYDGSVGKPARFCDYANFVRVAPAAPTVDLSINGGNGPATISFNGSATLTWTTTGSPNQCLLSPEVSPGGNVGSSGTRTPSSITGDTTYTITCTNAYGSAQDSVTAVVPPASVDMLANGSNGPISIAYGTAATISWTSANAHACNVVGNAGLSGSFSTGALTSSTTYTGECYGDGTGSDSVTVNVQAAAAPTVDILANGSASGATISYNTHATISWTSTNSNSCSVSPSGWGSTSNNGVITGNLTSTTTYTITCTGPGGSVQDSVTVTVNPPAFPTCTAALPDGDSVVGSEGSRYTYMTGVSNDVTSTIFYAWSESGGQNDMIAWPGQNEGGGRWSINIPHASHPDNGNIIVHAYMLTSYYDGSVSRPARYCNDANFVRVAPTPPSVDLLVNGGNAAVSVNFNGTATVSWTTGGSPNQCLFNPEIGAGGNVGASGSRTTGAMTADTTFTITCTSAYGSANDSITINVNPATIDMRADGSNGPIAIAYGASATISWTSTSAHSCHVPTSSGASGAVSGSFSTGALTSNTTYSGQCFGDGPVANDSVTVNVNPPAQPTCTAATPDGEWTIATTGTRLTTVTGVANATKVWFATFTDTQGSSNAIWHLGSNQGGGTWTMAIPHASHPGVGNVNIHVYLENTHYVNIPCNDASFIRRGYGTINVTSKNHLSEEIPTSWTLTCVLTNPACPTYSSGANQTTGAYTNVPASNWTIVPAVIPGYTATVTQGTTQTLPNVQP